MLQELARPDGSPTDVDREFVAMYWVAHERMTFYAGPPADPCLRELELPLIMHAWRLPCHVAACLTKARRWSLSEMCAPESAEENIEEFLPGTILPGNAIDPSNTTDAAAAALRDTLTDEADPSSEADHFYGINGARHNPKP